VWLDTPKEDDVAHPSRDNSTVKGREAGVEIFLRSLQKNTTPNPLTVRSSHQKQLEMGLFLRSLQEQPHKCKNY